MSRLNNRQFFLQHLAQTSPKPIGLEVARAEGIYIHDTEGKAYIDLIAGFSVCNIGHSHPKVIAAIEQQIKQYMHVIVYGEFIQSPQVQYAKALLSLLPENLQSIYFTNSGAEAAEGAMKLAKRVTKRTRIIAFDGAYHGSTQGALSVMGDEYFRNAYRPLLPDVMHLRYNNMEDIELIDHHVACVMVEPVQAETGITAASAEWLKALRAKCDALCILLIFDEVISGFRVAFGGASEYYNITPDIVTYGKIMGGGLPVGAYGAKREIMSFVSPDGPVYQAGTLSGNPVAMAAGIAQLSLCAQENFYEELEKKTTTFVEDINNFANTHELPVELVSIGSIFWFSFNGKKRIAAADQIDADMTSFNKLHHFLLNRGVYFGPSGYEVGFISSAHTTEQLAFSAEQIKEGLEAIYQ